MGFAPTVKQLNKGAAALGVRIVREAAALPQNATGNLFRVTGGKILLTSIVGQVTVEVVCAGAGNTNLIHTPTTGAAVATDLCGVLDLSAGDNGAVDAILTITGTVGDALVSDEKAGSDAPSMSALLLILQPGVIAVQQTHADTTGSIKWVMEYVALDSGAAVKRAI